jgi:hypothetical protein
MNASHSIVANDRSRPRRRGQSPAPRRPFVWFASLRGLCSCAVVSVLAALLAPSMAAASNVSTKNASSRPIASQTTTGLTLKESRTEASTALASANAVYRGSYRIYYDCDIAGFTGIYYGWWRGYVCQWNSWSQLWDLYA